MVKNPRTSIFIKPSSEVVGIIPFLLCYFQPLFPNPLNHRPNLLKLLFSKSIRLGIIAPIAGENKIPKITISLIWSQTLHLQLPASSTLGQLRIFLT